MYNVDAMPKPGDKKPRFRPKARVRVSKGGYVGCLGTVVRHVSDMNGDVAYQVDLDGNPQETVLAEGDLAPI